MKKEPVLLVISIGSFLAYIVLSFWNYKAPLKPITNEFYSLIFLLGVLQFYIYALVKILRSNIIGLEKIVLFITVLITGHIGSWVYSLYYGYKYWKKHVPETDKIEMRPFKQAGDDQEQKKSAV